MSKPAAATNVVISCRSRLASGSATSCRASSVPVMERLLSCGLRGRLSLVDLDSTNGGLRLGRQRDSHLEDTVEKGCPDVPPCSSFRKRNLQTEAAGDACRAMERRLLFLCLRPTFTCDHEMPLADVHRDVV